ncbi:glycosyltransferase family 39 protein [Geomobilimonas luticola]|uniref:Glycosyltransferase family 39 protein n=1 Tax=Geomobilimonas luticola TaxID=1114878 RepID=A0ABS5SH30_9BACT|nr:glycosyltransferase family 39 protein [Geomobilimonas luticola]MBT0654668.1 glycosyltransferase family 39 protein [Geomobilimonas luticola]
MKFITDFLTAKESSARKDLGALLVIFGVAFFQFLGHLPLFEPDEARYAEIPREMLERGDFITPMLNYVKYFEKPPLLYWLNALSLSLFGENEFAARFACALAGLLTVLLTYHVGRTLFGRREGLFAALILGTSTGFLIQARINLTDMLVTFCMTACLGCFAIAVRDNEPRRGLYCHLGYLFAALAVLAKGLIGIVFPGAIIFLYLLLGKRWQLLKEMRLVTGTLLFLLVSAPWFILVSQRNPEFARFFFIHEHFQRFTSKVHGRYQPPWFFIPVLLGTMLPWSFFIPTGLRGVWRERLSVTGRHALYLAIWAIFIFVFFSKSDSKLVPYILPVFPPLALLMGREFVRQLDGPDRFMRIQGYVLAAILIILGVGVCIYPYFPKAKDLSPLEGLVTGSIFLVEGVAALAMSRRGNLASLFLALCFCAYLLGIVGPISLMDNVATRKSSKDLCLIVKEAAGPDAVIASFGHEQGLPFYTHRRVVTVGGMGELEFGSKQGDQSAWFMDPTQFSRVWDGPKQVFLLLRDNHINEFRPLVKTPIRELGRNKKKVLVTNR